MPRATRSRPRRPPADLRALLRRCHERLYGRGVAHAEEDLTMDMVRLLLAKTLDEAEAGARPAFACTPAEAATEAGRAAVAARVQALFARVRRRHAGVFGADERITVGPRAIVDVVLELQHHRLRGEADLLGEAYEEYTSTHLKRQRGQFFTNRLVVDLVAGILDPAPGAVVLDPAGGSGGFLTGAVRHARRAGRAGPGGLFMVEASARLVKVARAALVLAGATGDGVTQGDGLGAYARLDPRLAAGCGRGAPDVIMTNPPFAGVGEGRIADPEVLRGFACAAGLGREGAPPEMLFFERCLDWLRPGGRLGIVLPKSFLDTRTYLPARALLFARARLLAVVSLHQHTFQPHTGVRTCVVVVEKLARGAAPPRAYPIFMACSRRSGQDSEGVPIYGRDAANRPTGDLDHDLGEILAAWREQRAGRLAASEHRFTVERADLDADLRINPQLFLPSLNRTLREVAALDGVRGWSVVTLGAVAPDVAIYKGPRLQSERLLVEGGGAAAVKSTVKSGVEPYYTPSALLQENADGLKWLDLARATPAQRRVIAAIRVRRGDILVTRSGSIGRVVAVTARADGAIVSDDMIRVRIADERTRLWVLRFLESPYGQDQMRRNEYGAIQQHLEPAHLRALLIPVPDDWGQLAAVIAATRAAVAAREALQAARAESHAALRAALGLD